MSEDNKLQDVYREEIAAPDNIQFEEDSLVEAFMVEDLDTKEVAIYEPDISRRIKIAADTVEKELSEKSFEGSNQDLSELGNGSLLYTNEASLQVKIVDPPYSPECMAKFLEVDDIHFRAVKTKVTDSVGKQYKFKPTFRIESEDESQELVVGDSEDIITQDDFVKDCKLIKNFIKNCNDMYSFEDICFKSGMDKEGIGWGAFEVIREASGKIAKLNHLPAVRLRVLKGFEGFVEKTSQMTGGYVYYLPFGHKVLKDIENPLNPEETISRPYIPEEDGPLNMKTEGLRWNLVSKKTGTQLEATNFVDAANEVLFLPTVHSNTVYYGYSDAIPAIGAIVSNTYIRDNEIQYFEHNCVPRYAVIVRGAKVDDQFKKMIYDYFENKVKGSAHKTLILTISGLQNKNLEVTFEKIDADRKEADFIETRKNNNQIIMTSHGTSAAILGINEAASLGSGKGLSQAELYKDRIVRPLQLYWARSLNKLFRLGLGVLNAEIEFDPFDVRDTLNSAQALNLFLQNGITTINEARRELGIGTPLKGGDTAFVRIKNGSFVKVSDIPKIKQALETQEQSLAENEGVSDIEIVPDSFDS